MKCDSCVWKQSAFQVMLEYMGNGVNNNSADPEEWFVNTFHRWVRPEPMLRPSEHEEKDQCCVDYGEPIGCLKPHGIVMLLVRRGVLVVYSSRDPILSPDCSVILSLSLISLSILLATLFL